MHVKEPWAGSTREARLPAGWKKKRARILRRDHHRCQWIDEHGPCPLPATEVDHVDPQGGDGDHNLRALCAPHHRTKSAREGALVRNQRPLGE